VGQLDVLHHCQLLVPAGHARVSCGQDGGAGVEGADDAGFGNGERLLLHHLVQDAARAVCHLVKLVYAANTVVTQHQGSAAWDGRSQGREDNDVSKCVGSKARGLRL